MTCNGCKFDRDGRCHALPPAPRTDGREPDRAVWPRHGNAGCGAYQPLALDPAEGQPPKRTKLKGA